jgi:hypothetical protein
MRGQPDRGNLSWPGLSRRPTPFHPHRPTLEDCVMVGLDPTIHAGTQQSAPANPVNPLASPCEAAWILGSSPRMTWF